MTICEDHACEKKQDCKRYWINPKPVRNPYNFQPPKDGNRCVGFMPKNPDQYVPAPAAQTAQGGPQQQITPEYINMMKNLYNRSSMR